jgi:putative SOS response-associated peptidase YedK
MCYNVSYLTRKQEKYAKRYGASPEEVAHIKEQLNLFDKKYFVSGFSHPNLPVITDEHPTVIQSYSWGMIPFWAKDILTAVKLSNQCLNARGESIFEKPAFRQSAKSRRCLITCIDGFYEYYHFKDKTYPYYITLKKDEPMTFAGLWDRWENKEEGIVRYTVTIVTTDANKLMEKIHNNPKRENGDSRMPVILPAELERDWLRPMNDKADKELLQELIKPYPDELMEARTVRQLAGKSGVGNTETAHEHFEYEELKDDDV